MKPIMLGMFCFLLVGLYCPVNAKTPHETVKVLIKNHSSEPTTLYIDYYQDAVHCKRARDIPIKRKKAMWLKLPKQKYVTLSINGITEEEEEDNESGCGHFFSFKLSPKRYPKEVYTVSYRYTPLNGECKIQVQQRQQNGRYKRIRHVARMGRLNIFKGACRLNELKKLG